MRVSGKSLTQLEATFGEVIAKRRAIGEQLKLVRRNDRASLLEQHREIKADEYDLGEQIATLRWRHAIEGGDLKKINSTKTRLNRLQSRLSHQNWLIWTRSIWKFKDMESDAKEGKHPAQFSAKVPERLIAMYSAREETVLDCFSGSGTTSLVAKRLGRHSIGCDVNAIFVELANSRITGETDTETSHQVVVCDARKLAFVESSSVQLVVTHPPYWNCVRISEQADDLSNCDNESYEDFLDELQQCTRELFRVLQPDRVCAVMLGDVMRRVGGVTRLFPLHADFIRKAVEIGFIPWDIFIVETKMRDSGGMPMMGSYPYPHKLFSQFAHNYIVVLRKPALCESPIDQV